MEALGINPMLLVAQIVSFLILFWVFKKFLFGKIEEALKQRRESVAKTFSDRAEIEARLAGVEKELEQRRKEMLKTEDRMEEEAKKAAGELKKEILTRAEAEGAREIQKARERIRRETDHAKVELKQETMGMVKAMVEKIIAGKAGDETWQKQQLDLSRKQLERISKSK